MRINDQQIRMQGNLHFDVVTMTSTMTTTDTTTSTTTPSTTPTTLPIFFTSVILQSTYNSALVRAYGYEGPSTTLTWQLQHEICLDNGKNCPGTTDAAYQNQYCSYSSSDNYVVTNDCNWASQGFTVVEAILTTPSSLRGYMCAHSDCDHQVTFDGTSVVGQRTVAVPVTINPGDYVFCSP